MKDEGMKAVVRCGCGAKEYYGKMHWRDGHQYCRRCIYNIWLNDGWKGNVSKLPVFPDHEVIGDSNDRS